MGLRRRRPDRSVQRRRRPAAAATAIERSCTRTGRRGPGRAAASGRRDEAADTQWEHAARTATTRPPSSPPWDYAGRAGAAGSASAAGGVAAADRRHRASASATMAAGSTTRAAQSEATGQHDLRRHLQRWRSPATHSARRTGRRREHRARAGMARQSTSPSPRIPSTSRTYHYYYLYSLERVGRHARHGVHRAARVVSARGAGTWSTHQRPDGAWIETHHDERPGARRRASRCCSSPARRRRSSAGPRPRAGRRGKLQTAAALPPPRRCTSSCDCSGSMLAEMDGRPKFDVAAERRRRAARAAAHPARRSGCARLRPPQAAVERRDGRHRSELALPLEAVNPRAATLLAIAPRPREDAADVQPQRGGEGPVARAAASKVVAVLLTDGGDDTARAPAPPTPRPRWAGSGTSTCTSSDSTSRARSRACSSRTWPTAPAATYLPAARRRGAGRPALHVGPRPPEPLRRARCGKRPRGGGGAVRAVDVVAGGEVPTGRPIRRPLARGGVLDQHRPHDGHAVRRRHSGEPPPQRPRTTISEPSYARRPRTFGPPAVSARSAGHDWPAGHKFCTSCGAKLPAVVLCG